MEGQTIGGDWETRLEKLGGSVVNDIGAFLMDPADQTDVFDHNGDTLGMHADQIGIFQDAD